MNIYIIARFIMCDGNINKNNGWKEKKVSKMDSIVCAKNQIVNTLQDIELANGTILSKNILEALEQKTYSAVFEKYDFSPVEKNRFLGGLKTIRTSNSIHECGIQYKPDPKHPSWRGSSDVKWIHSNDYSWAYLGTTIYVNPHMVYDELSLFSVLFHELDHYAYKIRKFSKKMAEAHKRQSSKEQIKNLIEEITLEDEKQCNRFSTELLARVDTADELVGLGASNDIVNKFGIGNEHETTGETHYSESIVYSRKFFNFQMGLYNLLGKTFGLDSSKPKNKQLPETANNQFQTIMNRLRNEIFNSSSIERSKNVIDESYRKLEESGGSWNKFCSLRK